MKGFKTETDFHITCALTIKWLIPTCRAYKKEIESRGLNITGKGFEPGDPENGVRPDSWIKVKYEDQEMICYVMNMFEDFLFIDRDEDYRRVNQALLDDKLAEERMLDAVKHRTDLLEALLKSEDRQKTLASFGDRFERLSMWQYDVGTSPQHQRDNDFKRI